MIHDTTTTPQEVLQAATPLEKNQSFNSHNLSLEDSLDFKPSDMVRSPSVLNFGSKKQISSQMTQATFSELNQTSSKGSVGGNFTQKVLLPSVEENSTGELEGNKLTFVELKKSQGTKKYLKRTVKRVQSDNLFSKDVQMLARQFDKFDSEVKVLEKMGSMTQFPAIEESSLDLETLDFGAKRVKVDKETEMVVCSARSTAPLKTVKIEKKVEIEAPKPGKFLQIGVFFTMILLSFANYFFYNTPGMFAEALTKKFNITMVQIGYLYAVQSIPNYIGVPLGTTLKAKMGLGFGTLMFASLNFLGTIVFLFGIKTGSFKMLLLGRAFFGLGFDNMMNCQNEMASLWFKGKFLSMALGLNQFMAVTGIASSTFFLPRVFLSSGKNLNTVFVICACFSVVTIACAIIYTLIHAKCHKKYFQAKSADSNQKTAKTAKTKGFNLKDIGSLNKMFWLCVLCFILASNSYFRFLNIVTDFLVIRFNYTLIEVSTLTSIVPVLNMILIPIMSSIVTVKGKKVSILMGATLVGFGIYGTMLILPAEKSWLVSLLILCLSLFFSLYISAAWSCITMSMPSQLTGVGFGCTILA